MQIGITKRTNKTYFNNANRSNIVHVGATASPQINLKMQPLFYTSHRLLTKSIATSFDVHISKISVGLRS